MQRVWVFCEKYKIPKKTLNFQKKNSIVVIIAYILRFLGLHGTKGSKIDSGLPPF